MEQQQASVPEQPDGIEFDTHELPRVENAVPRVQAYMSEAGDGVYDTYQGTTLYARDLAALCKYAEKQSAAVASTLEWMTREYEQCIVAARATTDGHYYATCNGRAEAYRQAGDHLAQLSGVDAPDWDQIRRKVPRGFNRAPSAARAQRRVIVFGTASDIERWRVEEGLADHEIITVSPAAVPVLDDLTGNFETMRLPSWRAASRAVLAEAAARLAEITAAGGRVVPYERR